MGDLIGMLGERYGREETDIEWGWMGEFANFPRQAWRGLKICPAPIRPNDNPHRGAIYGIK